MRNLGLNVTFERQSNQFVEEGRIISTFPEAGTYISTDTKITVYVSTGAEVEYIEIPDFTGMNPRRVYDTIMQLGIRLDNYTYEYSNSVTSGLVCGQNIAPGARVPKGYEGLVLMISKGPEPLPDPPAPPAPTPTPDPLPDPDPTPDIQDPNGDADGNDTTD